MGSQCSFSRRGVEWWWRGAKKTSLAVKFWIFWRGWMTELGVPSLLHSFNTVTTFMYVQMEKGNDRHRHKVWYTLTILKPKQTLCHWLWVTRTIYCKTLTKTYWLSDTHCMYSQTYITKHEVYAIYVPTGGVSILIKSAHSASVYSY